MRQDRDRRLESMPCLPAGHCLVTGALWYRLARPVPASTTAAQHVCNRTSTIHALTLWTVMRECCMCGTEPCVCSAWRRCMSCDRSLLALESDAGPHIAQPGFASTAVECARANGMDPERSPPPQRALQRPHTSGTIGNDGLDGSASERLRGAQSWCACSASCACFNCAQLVASTKDLRATVVRHIALWPWYAPNLCCTPTGMPRPMSCCRGKTVDRACRLAAGGQRAQACTWASHVPAQHMEAPARTIPRGCDEHACTSDVVVGSSAGQGDQCW